MTGTRVCGPATTRTQSGRVPAGQGNERKAGQKFFSQNVFSLLQNAMSSKIGTFTKISKSKKWLFCKKLPEILLLNDVGMGCEQ